MGKSEFPCLFQHPPVASVSSPIQNVSATLEDVVLTCECATGCETQAVTCHKHSRPAQSLPQCECTCLHSPPLPFAPKRQLEPLWTDALWTMCKVDRLRDGRRCKPMTHGYAPGWPCHIEDLRNCSGSACCTIEASARNEPYALGILGLREAGGSQVASPASGEGDTAVTVQGGQWEVEHGFGCLAAYIKFWLLQTSTARCRTRYCDCRSGTL